MVNAEAKIDTSSPFPANLNITQSSHIYIANSWLEITQYYKTLLLIGVV